MRRQNITGADGAADLGSRATAAAAVRSPSLPLSHQPQKLPPISTDNYSYTSADPRRDALQKRRNSNDFVLRRADSYGWSVRSPGVPTSRNSLRSTLSRAWYHVRRPSQVWRARIRTFALLLSALFLLDAWLIASYRPQGKRVSAEEIPKAERPRVFIASIHRNTEPILRSYWSGAVLDLVTYLQPENVFVSIYESGSVADDTKGALADLDGRLGRLNVARNITIDPLDQLEEVARVVEEKEDGWIWTPRNKYELRRIPYLSQLRNRVMQELYVQEQKGERYDYVLWINDVVFTTEDVMTLLHTNDGNFDSACGMDYKQPHGYYDTFALRDMTGSKALPNTWPYFTYSPSRDALIALDAVPVRSCWNGIIAMKAAAFYASPPLRFRGVPDSLAAHHLEGSECCLIHADNDGSSSSSSSGVWLNPNVRVAYNHPTYAAVNPAAGSWPGAREKVWGLWRNRWQRAVAWPKRRVEASIVRKRVQQWMGEEAEKGRLGGEAEHCLINEMQVLESAGWRHL